MILMSDTGDAWCTAILIMVTVLMSDRGSGRDPVMLIQ